MITAERFRSREIDYKLKLGGLLNWQVGWLRTAWNLVDKLAGAPEQVPVVNSIGDETYSSDVGRLVELAGL